MPVFFVPICTTTDDINDSLPFADPGSCDGDSREGYFGISVGRDGPTGSGKARELEPLTAGVATISAPVGDPWATR